MAVRAPLDIFRPLTGGAPNIRTPLVVTGAMTGGVPNMRAPLIIAGAMTGGVPNIRSPLIIAGAMTGGVPHIRSPLIVLRAVIPEPQELPVATLVFPTLRGGLKWDRVKAPSYNNARREMTSGRRSVTPFMTYPRWNFELAYEVMPDTRYLSGTNIHLDSVQSIVDLFKQTQGGATAFLYRDPDDYHIVGGSIATADGVTTQWPFYAPIMGSVLEPVGQIDLSALVSFAAAAVNTTTHAINIPGHGFVSGQYPPMFITNSGGSLPTPLAVNIPYWPIVVDANNIQLAATAGGAAIALSAAGTGTDTLSKGWAAYLAISENDSVPATGPYTITVAHASAYVSDNGVTISGVSLTKVSGAPATNQYSVSAGVYTFNSAQASAAVVISYKYFGSATLTLPNQLLFSGAPSNAAVITADFDFYFQCRFDDDKLSLSEFVNLLYELQKLTFSSEII